ncbi:hypothetical protein [Streptomyces sp. RFCAC02]|uniref:hypothetical protein n=1 Tax=Streptomyces sp. RFCAC02 TaxID=2499143 RepID=UPI00101E999F|nr:hypothetical protein [Streptomyces sp. RFCAC02]
MIWAGLCLSGMAVTWALNAWSYSGGPESPAGNPEPSGTYSAECEAIADGIAQARFDELKTQEKERLQGQLTVMDISVPEECADELEARGLIDR